MPAEVSAWARPVAQTRRVSALHRRGGPERARPGAAGDVVVGATVLKDWGLHLIDANLTIGNLLDVVGDETKAYLGKK